MIMLSVVDILNETNITITPTQQDADIIASVFAAETYDHEANLGNRISRKKQITPLLTDHFAQ
jgi:manganese-dependent inorganic pyrophosphatase